MATEKWLIEANELKEKLRLMVKWFEGPLCTEQDKLAQAVIKKCIGEVDKIEPVDAVEVVRCKGCVRGDIYSNRPCYIFCMEHHRLVDKNDFCSYGERRTADA